MLQRVLRRLLRLDFKLLETSESLRVEWCVLVLSFLPVVVLDLSLLFVCESVLRVVYVISRFSHHAS